MRLSERIETDNIVRISANKSIVEYLAPIIIKIQPSVYKKYGCVKLRFTKDIEQNVKLLCQLVWHVGLVPKEKTFLDGGIPVNKGILIADAREITLKKIGAIDFEDQEDFEDWWKNAEYKKQDKND